MQKLILHLSYIQSDLVYPGDVLFDVIVNQDINHLM